MAKKKKRGRRQGIVSKAMNIALILLAFSKPLEILIRGAGGIGEKLGRIKRGATFGLSDGAFNLQAGLRMYAPVAAAVALGTLKSFVLKKFPVR